MDKRNWRRLMLICDPGKAGTLMGVEATPEAMEELLGGEPQYLKICTDMWVAVSGTASMRGEKYNCTICGKDVFGRAVFLYRLRDRCVDFPGHLTYLVEGFIERKEEQQLKLET